MILPDSTVADIVIGSTDHKTLTAAVIAAELLPALTDPGAALTVFAPNDAAFEELGTAVDDLLQDPTGGLKDVLLYHVLGSKVTSDLLSQGQVAETLLDGESITVDLSSGVQINMENVIGADLEKANGVVHVLDGVLLPETITSVMNELEFGSLEVSPNPASNQFFIHVDAEQVNVVISSLTGEVVAELIDVSPTQAINIAELISGIYMVNVTSDSKAYMAKMIIE